jgi:hypothetical protein
VHATVRRTPLSSPQKRDSDLRDRGVNANPMQRGSLLSLSLFFIAIHKLPTATSLFRYKIRISKE